MNSDSVLIMRNDPPGVFYERRDHDRVKILDALRHREKIRKATGQEVFVLMLSNDRPDWRLYEQTIRIRLLDGTLRNFSDYTILSSEAEARLESVSEKPDPVEPMGWQK